MRVVSRHIDFAKIVFAIVLLYVGVQGLVSWWVILLFFLSEFEFKIKW